MRILSTWTSVESLSLRLEKTSKVFSIAFNTAFSWKNCSWLGQVHLLLANKLARWLGLGSGGQWSYTPSAVSQNWCFPGLTKSCIIPLSMIWTKVWLAPRSVSRWCLVGQELWFPTWGLCTGIWTGWISGLRSVIWGSTTPSARSCTCSEPRQLHRLGENRVESCPAEKELGMLADSQLNMGQCMPRWPRKLMDSSINKNLECAQKE